MALRPRLLRLSCVLRGVSSTAPRCSILPQCRAKATLSDDAKSLSDMIEAIRIQPIKASKDVSVGEELTGKLSREPMLQALNKFSKRAEVRQLAQEHGIDERIFHKVFMNFRHFCMESTALPSELHVVFSDIIREAGHVDDLFPHFLKHAQQMYPHLVCIDDLRKISDLKEPSNWYPVARAMVRKVIFHAGPTNSGKTFQALESFMTSKSGVYCSPLKLLASEVFHKTNNAGTPCDLVTGEERRYASEDLNKPAPHRACTVEMVSTQEKVEVGILDEIQMIRDPQRGWAWTRALLGLPAEELHICGEASAIDLVKELLVVTNEDVEVRYYKRMTPLRVLNHAVEKFENLRDGDCIVAFSKNDIYHIARQLEQRGKKAAVIYGSLPPGAKLNQAAIFNDPDHPCKILVATDAVGMGLNLCIKRLVFYSLQKPTLLESGEKEMGALSTSQLLQIAGRAGRYGTRFADGEVTTFRSEHLPLLKELFGRPIEPIQIAGIFPTTEQIELFAYHLPKQSLKNLLEVFQSLMSVDDSRFFMCTFEDVKYYAEMIDQVPIPIREKYVFCLAPINRKQTFVSATFVKFARYYSNRQAITIDIVARETGFPYQFPRTLADLVRLEAVFDVLDMYLWLSYRFPAMFPDADLVRTVQSELDQLIQDGVANVAQLLRNSETTYSSGISASGVDSEAEEASRRARDKYRRMIEERGEARRMGSPPIGQVGRSLVARGVLTAAQLEQLKAELLAAEKKKPD